MKMSLKALGFVAAAWLATVVPAASAPLREQQIDPDFKLVQVAPDVYAFVAGNTTHDWVDGNTTVIVTSEGVVVVDAPNTGLTRRHLRQIRKITDQPVRYLVNTHWHSDHILGNHLYAEAFPGLAIIASENTHVIGDRRNPEIIAQFFHGAAGEDLIKGARETVEKGVDAEGKPLSDYDRMRAERALGEFTDVIEGGRDTVYAPANVVIDEDMTITLGGKRIEISVMGGHTRGDIVVYLPEDKILITGDLVIAPTPYGINPMFDAWIDSLNALLAFDAKVIVPGHGDVQFDKTYVTLLRDMLSDLMRQAIDAARKRLTLDEFKAALNLDSFKQRFAGQDPELLWGWTNYFYDNAIERAYRIARGEL